MARWEANARERLAHAALELFAEQGYDRTTVVEIAARAGLTKSTFFRHFADKREVLFDQDVMTSLLVETIATTPAQTSPLDAVEAAVEAAGQKVFTSARRPVIARRHAVIAANPELQEREALKGLALTDAMAQALQRRNVPPMTARVAAELGALAFATAMDRWTDSRDTQAFTDVARQAFNEMNAAVAAR
jgi:AcrR family transcriptional regulator